MLGLKEAVQPGPPLYRIQNVKELNVLSVKMASKMSFIDSNFESAIC